MSLITTSDTKPTTIQLLQAESLSEWLSTQTPTTRAWLKRLQFAAKPGQIGWISGEDAAPMGAIVGWDGNDDLSSLGGLPFELPEGNYQLVTEVSDLQLTGWGLGAYRFDRYKTAPRAPAQLLIPERNDAEGVSNMVAAVTLIRDLINTPADDMTPDTLALEATQVADTHQAKVTITLGDELLAAGFGAIHAVGRAAAVAPRLIDITWGNPAHPAVTLVGKGVCFDNGGLNLKPAAGMRWMKKDMGGAAQALGLAQMIMAAGLPIRLRLLIAAVENAVAGNAYRPGDILQTYKGLTVEIDNTDAEGRLVMCDALALAAEDKPELLIDFSTLTGSARSALGPEVGAMFSNRDDVATALMAEGQAKDDPVWRLPLHKPYRSMLDSKVADIVNSASTPMAGAITAALFLERFVGDCPWVHFDIHAFNTRPRPARPEGGEATAARAVFGYLQQRFGR
jgi:leucyl aminopeptidase